MNLRKELDETIYVAKRYKLYHLNAWTKKVIVRKVRALEKVLGLEPVKLDLRIEKAKNRKTLEELNARRADEWRYGCPDRMEICCPYCGKEYSEFLDVCPDCGMPQRLAIGITYGRKNWR